MRNILYRLLEIGILRYCKLVENFPRVLRKPTMYALMKPIYIAVQIGSKINKTSPLETWDEFWSDTNQALDNLDIEKSKLSKILE